MACTSPLGHAAPPPHPGCAWAAPGLLMTSHVIESWPGRREVWPRAVVTSRRGTRKIYSSLKPTVMRRPLMRGAWRPVAASARPVELPPCRFSLCLFCETFGLCEDFHHSESARRCVGSTWPGVSSRSVPLRPAAWPSVFRPGGLHIAPQLWPRCALRASRPLQVLPTIRHGDATRLRRGAAQTIPRRFVPN